MARAQPRGKVQLEIIAKAAEQHAKLYAEMEASRMLKREKKEMSRLGRSGASAVLPSHPHSSSSSSSSSGAAAGNSAPTGQTVPTFEDQVDTFYKSQTAPNSERQEDSEFQAVRVGMKGDDVISRAIGGGKAAGATKTRRGRKRQQDAGSGAAEGSADESVEKRRSVTPANRSFA